MLNRIVKYLQQRRQRRIIHRLSEEDKKVLAICYAISIVPKFEDNPLYKLLEKPIGEKQNNSDEWVWAIKSDDNETT